jgi:hypothetical protein
VHLLMSNSIYLKPVDWLRNNYPFRQLQLLSKTFSQTRAQPSQLPIFSGLVRRRRLLELPE